MATGDLGGMGRVWDLRSGKSVWTMEGHVKVCAVVVCVEREIVVFDLHSFPTSCVFLLVLFPPPGPLYRCSSL